MALFPTPNTVGGGLLPQANMIHYKTKALDVLQATLHFSELCTPDECPKYSGMTVQWWRPQNFPAGAVTETTEGDIGTSLTFTGRTLPARLAWFGDFCTTSTISVETGPQGHIQYIADRFSYMEAVRVDTLSRLSFDAEYNGSNLALLGGTTGYLTANDIRNVRTQLRNNNVRPMKNFGNNYAVALSPLISYSILAEQAVGGFLDMVKYNSAINNSAFFDYSGQYTNDQIMQFAGCQFIETTNVKYGINSSISASSNAYRTYVVGEGAMINFSLVGRGPSKVSNPDKQRFNIDVVPLPKGSLVDPMNKIGGYVASYYPYGVVCAEGPSNIGGNYRFRTFDSLSPVG